MAGRAEEVTDAEGLARYRRAAGEQLEEGSFHLFRVDLSEVVLTKVDDPPDHLIIESWRQGERVRRTERR